MAGGSLDEEDSSDVQREAIIEMANLTNGMTGGIFDTARGSSRVLGLSRPHSNAIWRVRATSAIAALTLAVLFVASALILALTVGRAVGVTIALGAAALVAGIVWVSSYPAERREIARRAAPRRRTTRRLAAR